MSQRMFVCVFALTISVLSTGCAMMQPVQEATRQSMRAVTPRSSGYRDGTDEAEDPWSTVGTEARGDRPMEEDPDPWYKKYFMSSKANSIEHNLGIQ